MYVYVCIKCTSYNHKHFYRINGGCCTHFAFMRHSHSQFFFIPRVSLWFRPCWKSKWVVLDSSKIENYNENDGHRNQSIINSIKYINYGVKYETPFWQVDNLNMQTIANNDVHQLPSKHLHTHTEYKNTQFSKYNHNPY